MLYCMIINKYYSNEPLADIHGCVQRETLNTSLSSSQKWGVIFHRVFLLEIKWELMTVKLICSARQCQKISHFGKFVSFQIELYSVSRICSENIQIQNKHLLLQFLSGGFTVEKIELGKQIENIWPWFTSSHHLPRFPSFKLELGILGKNNDFDTNLWIKASLCIYFEGSTLSSFWAKRKTL